MTIMLKYEFWCLTAGQKTGIINTNICSYTFEAVESCVIWTAENTRLWKTFAAVENFFACGKLFLRADLEPWLSRKKKKKKEKVAKRNKEKENTKR